MHLDVRVLDKLALVPLSVGVDVLDVAIGVDPFESEVVPVDGGGGGRRGVKGHCVCLYVCVLAMGWIVWRGAWVEE